MRIAFYANKKQKHANYEEEESLRKYENFLSKNIKL